MASLLPRPCAFTSCRPFAPTCAGGTRIRGRWRSLIASMPQPPLSPSSSKQRLLRTIRFARSFFDSATTFPTSPTAAIGAVQSRIRCSGARVAKSRAIAVPLANGRRGKITRTYAGSGLDYNFWFCNGALSKSASWIGGRPLPHARTSPTATKMASSRGRARLEALSAQLGAASLDPAAEMCLRGAHHVQSCPALSPSLSSSGAADNDSWEAEVAELHLRRKLAKVAPEDEIGVKRQRDQGKLLVRERIAAVVDPGSFQEIGSAAGFAVRDTQGRIVGYQRSNLIAGLARIDGQLVMVGGDDFSVRGGSAERSILSKLEYTESLAREYRIPLIRICDGAAGSVNALFAKGSTYIPKNPNMGQAVKMLHEIPVVAAVVGSAAGWSAAKGVLTHFSVMSADTGSLYAAGPPVVEPATGEKLSKEALGGVRVHCTNGVMDNPAENELDAFEQCKRFLSYLPANRWLMPPLRDPPVGEWPTAEGNAKLLRVIPKRDSKPYDPKEYLDVLLDPESLFEIGPIWGRSHRTFLARVNGKPVVVLASDPRFEGGAITHDAAMKVSRIIGIANTFHLPIVSFVDCPGFVVGSKAEKTGAIRAGTRLGLMAQESKVPWFTILIRKVYGVAGSIFATRGQGNTEDSAGIDPRYCWPSLSSGSIPIEGGTMAAFKRQLGNIADEGERKKELARIEGELREIANPFRMVERFEAEEMIDPRETRGLMVQWVEEVAYRSKIPQLIARDSTLQPGVIAFYSPY